MKKIALILSIVFILCSLSSCDDNPYKKENLDNNTTESSNTYESNLSSVDSSDKLAEKNKRVV